jgi:DNA-binding transcriptional MerR regulator
MQQKLGQLRCGEADTRKKNHGGEWMSGDASGRANTRAAGIAIVDKVDGPAERGKSPDAEAEGSLDDGSAAAPLTIAEVAEQYGITPRTLRFYEAKQLIAPYRRGTTRLYRSSDCRRLGVILDGRRLGFTLAEIKHLLTRPNDGGLQLTREQCVKQISMLERQKRGIETAIAELRQIHTSFYQRLLDEGGGEPSH